MTNDFSSHPGPGQDGVTTAAGMYQINRDTWKDISGGMGLSDFTPETQDLIAIEILRISGVIESVVDGDITPALSSASRRWAALPQGLTKVGVMRSRTSPTRNSRASTRPTAEM